MKKNRTIPFRRKREGRTNYRKRLKLLLSGKPRLVIRRSNKHLLLQGVAYSKEGDFIECYASTNELIKLGWKGNTGNIPAAYLAGLLFGKKARSKNLTSFIADIGMYSIVKNSLFFTALKGVADNGIDINLNKKMLPSEDRLKGKHIEDFARLLSDKNYKKVFSGLIKKGFKPENLTAHFAEIREKML